MICSAAVAICYVSDLPPGINVRRGTFFLAKTIQGFAVGGIMCTTQTWLSEILPMELRGPLMAFFPIFKLLGQLVGALVCFSQNRFRVAYVLPPLLRGTMAILCGSSWSSLSHSRESRLATQKGPGRPTPEEL